ncbi:MAG: pyridoxine biosynthesis protein [Piccolia ochrophora]|nr:MAG: pyridoxine biosynthesis protein [Piccolia ochrophora]
MPAMSPTMTEGNIASWKINEGDSFSAGDVILEIETDKAQMDVEAQDDGKMAKIMLPGGSKSVRVGSRIAVIAEPEDDLASIALPTEGTPSESSSRNEKAPSSPQEELSSGVDPSQSSESQAEAPPTSKDTLVSKTSDESRPSAPPQTQNYPLSPSVQHLLHLHNLPDLEATKIHSSGPRGRLLKGDVLAHLGNIDRSSAGDLAASVLKRSHLDLSNIRVAPHHKEAPPLAESAPSASKLPSVESATEVALPVSLSAVVDMQHRLQQTLGTHLPLSAFVSRATSVANASLPKPSRAALSADELFREVLGQPAKSASRGSYLPEITAMAGPDGPSHTSQPVGSKQADVYDVLTGRAGATSRSPSKSAAGVATGSNARIAATNVFSVMATRGEERRARTFLERMKTVLEEDPGRLIL